ncbi:MAG: M60 family metallopeptidase [Flavobacteriaceae bacterium]|nr:M60 family metallopeptidase [Flavobacteriaceae bacterium]
MKLITKSTLAYISLFTIAILIGCETNDEEITAPGPTTPTTATIPKELAVESTQTFSEMLSGDAEARRLGLRFRFSDFEPTGVYVAPNTSFTLTVEVLQGTNIPELMVGTYSRADQWDKEPKFYVLEKGKNTINIGDEAGMVYIRYATSKNPTGKTKITFLKGWEHTPVFKLNKTTSANWKKMLETFNKVPSVTMIGNKSIVVVSREEALKYQDENINELLTSLDNVIKLQQDFSGMDGATAVHRPMSHKLLFSEYTGNNQYMFATNYRTGYSKDGVRFILNHKDFTQNGWGPWHEIGHMHQMNAWTWPAVLETTVNLYSLATEKAMGISPSRMKRDNIWEAVQVYLLKSEKDKDFNSDAANVWVRLGMFYQLQLAYGDGFYKKLHKNIRVEAPQVQSNDDRMRVFMLHACKAANKDLTTFFKAWGYKFNGVHQAYNQIAALGLDAPNIDLTQLQD